MPQISDFSFVAPSSEELWVRKDIQSKPWTIIIVHGFQQEIENFDFGKKSNHAKAHLKARRMVQFQLCCTWNKSATKNGLNFGQNP